MADTPPTIRFEDGAGYERLMGVWSRIAGERFLDWVQPRSGAAWLDVGCGNGAFTELVVSRCAPSHVTGVDPAPAQLDYARGRPGAVKVTYLQGDAMALPVGDGQFDVATMALVLFFVPDPAKGVAEMARALRPGGIACAYSWDIAGGGFPLAAVQASMRAMDLPVAVPPSVAAAALDASEALWREAGFIDVATTVIEVQRTFESFDDLWETALLSPSIGQRIQALRDDQLAELRSRSRKRLAPDAQGRITVTARANAIRGRKAG